MSALPLLKMSLMFVSLGAIWWQWPMVVGAGVENFAAVSLLKVSSCDPGLFPCSRHPYIYPPVGWSGNMDSLRRVQARLTTAVQILPRDEGVRLRLAETDFSLGEHVQSAALVPRMAVPTWGQGKVGEQTLAFPSPLMATNRWEGATIVAYQQASIGNWNATAQAMQEALAGGSEYLSQNDLQLYERAIAERYAASADGDHSARPAYLAGKYFFLAGDSLEAQSWLKQAQASRDWSTVRSADKSEVFEYLGMVYEERSLLRMAKSAYEEAARLDPVAVAPKVSILGVSSKLGDAASVDKTKAILEARGPLYPVGQSILSGSESQHTGVTTTWRLVGYDVDEDTLATGGIADLWLWWYSATQTATGNHVLGPWRIQHQLALNLAPNPGFDWGTYPNGFPVGYSTVVYDSAPMSMRVVTVADSNGSVDDVLRLDNDSSRSVGLVSLPIPVDPSAAYLLAERKREQTNNQGQIGMSCDDGETYYVAPGTASAGIGAWSRFAGVVTPGAGSTKCGIFLASFAKSGSMELTDMLLVRLQPPT